MGSLHCFIEALLLVAEIQKINIGAALITIGIPATIAHRAQPEYGFRIVDATQRITARCVRPQD